MLVSVVKYYHNFVGQAHLTEFTEYKLCKTIHRLYDVLRHRPFGCQSGVVGFYVVHGNVH